MMAHVRYMPCPSIIQKQFWKVILIRPNYFGPSQTQLGVSHPDPCRKHFEPAKMFWTGPK